MRFFSGVNIINQGKKLNQWKSTSICDHMIENDL